MTSAPLTGPGGRERVTTPTAAPHGNGLRLRPSDPVGTIVWHVHRGVRHEPGVVDAISSALDRIARGPGVVDVDGPRLTDPPAPAGGTVTATVTCAPGAEVRWIRAVAREVQSPGVDVVLTGDAFTSPTRARVCATAGAAATVALLALLARTVRRRVVR